MKKKVAYCNSSTIQEAWACVLGTPGPFNKDTTGSMMTRATDAISNLFTEASTEYTTNAEVLPPSWLRQVRWQDDSRRARFGHRYLSVHFLRSKAEEKYETFEQSLLPSIKQWLEIYGATSKDAANHVVDVVSAGYVNLFEFPGDSNLGEHFEFNFGANIGQHKGLNTLSFDLSTELEDETSLLFSFNAQSAPGVASPVLVRTVVEARRRIAQDRTFGDVAKIEENIYVCKDHAKASFFEFATSKTHELMGVVYAPD